MGKDKESQQVSAETGNEEAPIKFGSHSAQESMKDEGKKVPLRKDASEDWPAPKQVHSFYIVRSRRFEEPKLKAKIDLAEKELQKMNQARSPIIEKLRATRAERSKMIEGRRAVSAENQEFWTFIGEKRKEMEPLQDALGKLRGSKKGGREGGGLCSSEAELDDLIKSLHYRIQHESITLFEEKQILREIKRLEGTRGEVKEHMAVRAQIQDSVGEKETIQKQVKAISGNLDEVRKEQQVLKTKLRKIDDQLNANTEQIKVLDEELKEVTLKRDKAYANLLELRRQREESNAPFYQYSQLLQKAKTIANNKDIEALREFSLSEVNKFVSQWSSKPFRDDYEKRLLTSLDIRLLSRDGRMRNPYEKPLVLLSKAHAEIDEKNDVKPVKDESAQKVQKEKNSKAQKDASSKANESAKKEYIFDIEEEIPGIEKKPKDMDQKKDKLDEAKLREMKREEEIAKNKQAMERKKKLAEKAAAKAAIKAQKDAEKKLKKKAKKKGGASVPGQESADEQAETAADVAEEEKVEEKVETSAKDPKENTVKARPKRAKGMDVVPKTILKRKKAMNYWLWAAPAAVALPLLLVAYNHLV